MTSPSSVAAAWTAATIRLACEGGPRAEVVVVSPTAPGLALHRDAWDGTWSVTHAPSGLRVLRAIGTLPQAKYVAEELATRADWTRDAADLQTDRAAYDAVAAMDRRLTHG